MAFLNESGITPAAVIATTESESVEEVIVSIERGACATYLSMAIIGIMFNIVTVLVITKGSKFAKGLKISLLNLALSDLLFSLAVLEKSVTMLRQVRYPDNDAFKSVCHAVYFLRSFCMASSPLWTAAIAVEKCVIVYVSPPKHSYTLPKKLSVVVSVWLLALVLQIPVTFYAAMPDTGGDCVVKPPAEETILYHTYKGLNQARFAFPAAVMVLAYLLIGIKLCRRRQLGESGNHVRTTNNKVMRALTADAVVTVVTMIPSFFTLDFITTEQINDRSYLTTNFIYNILIYVNCLSTPILYYVLNASFREDMKLLFGTCFKDQSPTQIRTVEDKHTAPEREETIFMTRENHHTDEKNNNNNNNRKKYIAVDNK